MIVTYIMNRDVPLSMYVGIVGLRRIKISLLIRSPRSAPPLFLMFIPYVHHDRVKVLNYSIRTNTILVIAMWRSPSRLVSQEGRDNGREEELASKLVLKKLSFLVKKVTAIKLMLKDIPSKCAFCSLRTTTASNHFEFPPCCT